MAHFNPIQAPRFADGIRRLISEEAELSTISPELMATIILEDDPVENRLLFGKVPWAMRINTAAVAAQNQGIGIRNPLGSGIVVAITSWACNIGGAPSITLDIRQRVQSAAGVLVDATAFDMDSRAGFIGNSPVHGLSVSSAAVLGNGPVWKENIVETEHPDYFGGWWVLTPGFEVLFWNDTQNTAVDGSFRGWWRRQPRPEEQSIAGP
jgi:hypothetical protein